MSDFFYKEKLGPVFSPVIKVKHKDLPDTVISAIDNLLSPLGNMFTRAETVKNLMSIEKMGLEEAASALSLKPVDVANKLRLLEFSAAERAVILDGKFSETSALQFLRLDKTSRMYAMEYCRHSGYDTEKINEYVDDIVKEKTVKKKQLDDRIENVRKFVVNDIGFLLNSIENVLGMARRAGFEVQKENTEKDDSYDIHISVRKKQRNAKVDK